MCPNGVCINVDGSYQCKCNRGFTQSPNQQLCMGKLVQYQYYYWFKVF